MAFSSATRSSDQAQGTPANIISNNCVAQHDNTTVAHLMWCRYDAVVVTAAAAASHQIGYESDVHNLGTAAPLQDPFNINPSKSIENLRLASGVPGLAAPTRSSSYLVLTNNATNAGSGIVVANGALDTSVTANPPAIALPQNYALTWYVGAASISGKFFIDNFQKGWFTPTAGANIVGTNTNDNAGAGQIGEFVSSTVLIGSAISLTNGTAASLTSISLTAGDWDVSFDDYLVPGATTSMTAVQCSVSATTNVIDTGPGNFQIISQAAEVPVTSVGCKAGLRRMSLATTTTVFAVTQANFTPGTMTSYGIIRARRVR
jgi:hypothetical protein